MGLHFEFLILYLEILQMMESPSGFPGGSVVSDGCEHGYSSNSETIGQVGLSESRKRKVECDLDKDEEDHINEDRYLLGYTRALLH